MTDRQLDGMLREHPLPAPPARTIPQIQAAVLTDLRPVRPLAPRGLYVTALALVFLGSCALSCYLMPALGGWQALAGVRRWFVFPPLGLIAVLLLVSAVQQLTPAAKYRQQILEGSAGAIILLLAAIVILFHPIQETAFLENVSACFRVGMLFSIPAALIFFVLLRRGAKLSPGLAGATAGALAGFAGMTILEIHCPNFDLYHIIAAHGSVPMLCAIAGFILSSVASRCWIPTATR